MGAVYPGVSPVFTGKCWQMEAGTRYDVERRNRTESNDFEKDGVLTPLTAAETGTKTFHAFTPKLTVSYQLTDMSLVYASYTKGFRVGGFNAGAVV